MCLFLSLQVELLKEELDESQRRSAELKQQVMVVLPIAAVVWFLHLLAQLKLSLCPMHRSISWRVVWRASQAPPAATRGPETSRQRSSG